jgi:Glucose / Sorbosone dehydrogenase/Secretion system C-terminal sorting domain
LYIGMGDGGLGGDPENRSQNKLENLGKMLRIDVDNPIGLLNYGIPATNPYVGIAGNDEIWAIGVRNPWKFSFNRLNGDLWIADVGQNQIEEINKIVAPLPTGLNFGWRCYEGSMVYNNGGCPGIGSLTMPFSQYNHDQGCSITGGFFYTGSLYPNFANKYFFADYCENRLGYANASGTITYTPYFAGSNSFTTFGEDKDGELYVCNGSVIYKIVDTSQLVATSFEKAGFSLFPNPAQSEFYIKKNTSFSDLTVTVFDISGKQLLSQIIQNENSRIDTTSLSRGMYMVQVEDRTGSLYTTKLVVE